MERLNEALCNIKAMSRPKYDAWRSGKARPLLEERQVHSTYDAVCSAIKKLRNFSAHSENAHAVLSEAKELIESAMASFE